MHRRSFEWVHCNNHFIHSRACGCLFGSLAGWTVSCSRSFISPRRTLALTAVWRLSWSFCTATYESDDSPTHGHLYCHTSESVSPHTDSCVAECAAVAPLTRPGNDARASLALGRRLTPHGETILVLTTTCSLTRHELLQLAALFDGEVGVVHCTAHTHIRSAKASPSFSRSLCSSHILQTASRPRAALS